MKTQKQNAKIHVIADTTVEMSNNLSSFGLYPSVFTIGVDLSMFIPRIDFYHNYTQYIEYCQEVEYDKLILGDTND